MKEARCVPVDSRVTDRIRDSMVKYRRLPASVNPNSQTISCSRQSQIRKYGHVFNEQHGVACGRRRCHQVRSLQNFGSVLDLLSQNLGADQLRCSGTGTPSTPASFLAVGTSKAAGCSQPPASECARPPLQRP